MPQILDLPDTSVIAGGRPGDEFQDLEKLQNQYKSRLSIVQMELTDITSVQASTTCSFVPNAVVHFYATIKALSCGRLQLMQFQRSILLELTT